MNLINLMPHRERRLEQRRRRFNVGLGLSVPGALSLVLVASLAVESLLAQQVRRNQTLEAGTRALQQQEEQVRRLQAEITALKERQATVQGLQNQRNVPVAVTGELARLAPPGLALSSVRQADAKVAITGVAASNERVSDFLARLQHDSKALHEAELIEMKVQARPAGTGLRAAAPVRVGGLPAALPAEPEPLGERSVEFTLTVQIRPELAAPEVRR